MTLLICPECNAHVSEQTGACPVCGCPVKGTSLPVMEFFQKRAKRTKPIGFLMIVVAMVSLFIMVTNEEYGFTPWSVILFILGVIVFMLGRLKD